MNHPKPGILITAEALESAARTGRLDLSGSGIAELPLNIQSIPRIKELHLRGNRIASLPGSIGQFANLRLLNLDNNRLQKLPPEIGALRQLQELHLDFNQLKTLPARIGLMTQLQALTINNNDLERMPEQIGQLERLASFMVNSNKLLSVPASIGNLRSLQRLWIEGNQLTKLPKTIGNLRALRQLHLNDNLLDKLPTEIGDLENLQTLTLNGNLLTTLSEDVGRLPALEELDLRGNILSNLPAHIGNLESLRELRLDDNQLSSLPRELAPLLAKGMNLTFAHNPVNDPLVEIAKRGADALAAYLASLDDAIPQFEAKVLLVGEGNVGKTSLVAALHDEDFIANRSTTHGIEIRSLAVRHPNRTLNMVLRTWDFGGQEVYRITHQFFFSKRALYILVWSARDGQEHDQVEGWLSRIRMRVAGEASTIIVATHCSERAPEIDLPRLERLFPNLIVGMQEVDNSTDLGIAELRRMVSKEASKLPQMGQLISRSWIETRDELFRLATEDPQISFAKFHAICVKNGVAEREVRTLAELLHDLGQVIYYGDDEGLRDVIVLDPEWITRAISYVLEDSVTRKADGVLEHRRLKSIWLDRANGSSYAAEYHPYFLRLMEKFDVSYRLGDDERGSLVAQLVPHARPRLPWERNHEAKEGIRALRMICQLSEPAPGLIAWLTVRHHRSSTGRHWRRGVFLRYPIAAYASEALLEMTDNGTLSVEVRAPSPDLFFNVLRDSVENLITTRWPGIKYQLKVPCPSPADQGAGTCRALFPLDGLLRFREGGGLKHTCLECMSEHDVSRLLTGFEFPKGSPVPELEGLQRQVADVAGGVRRLEGLAADTAESIRRVLRLASTEVLDCPRLFTVVPASDQRLRRARKLYERSYRVVLWCEHTGQWHPWPTASYELKSAREWLTRVRPYATVVYSALRVVVPVAAAVSELAFPGVKYQKAETDLSLMGSLLQSLPVLDPGSEPDVPPVVGEFAPAEGQALRSFRVFLFERDRTRSFGGLRRVEGPSGEVLWVCQNHHSEYDPGLPTMP